VVGPLLDEENYDEIDTVGGLVIALAGRVPGRGEIVRHPSGLEFEILDSDPRHVSMVNIRGLNRVGGPSPS
jgi:CBS domain containing-hemolysin-like protein